MSGKILAWTFDSISYPAPEKQRDSGLIFFSHASCCIFLLLWKQQGHCCPFPTFCGLKCLNGMRVFVCICAQNKKITLLFKNVHFGQCAWVSSSLTVKSDALCFGIPSVIGPVGWCHPWYCLSADPVDLHTLPCKKEIGDDLSLSCRKQFYNDVNDSRTTYGHIATHSSDKAARASSR